MSKEETPKKERDYKGWVSLLIGACAVWIAYESFAWQKNQTENNDGAPAESSGQKQSPEDNTSETKISNSSQTGSGTSSGNSEKDEKDTKKDPIETIDKVYDGYKALDLDKDWMKKKNKEDK